MNAKTFHKNTIETLGLSFFLFLQSILIPSYAIDYPYATLTEAYKAANFDPNNPNNLVFVATSDLGYLTTGNDVDVVVSEVNLMAPSPKFFIVTGDLAATVSASYGVVPNYKTKLVGANELKQARQHLTQLKSGITLRLVLGNHDQYPREVPDGDTFQSVFPEHPIYQSFSQAGVHFVILNGHACGHLDKKQINWLKKDLAKTPVDQTLVIFLHQPDLGNVTSHRELTIALKGILSDRTAEVWLVGGHIHVNQTTVWKLDKTNIIQSRISPGTSNNWGGERPGYWIFGISNGHVVARIYRRLGFGYRLETAPNYNAASAIKLPFEGRTDILWKNEVSDCTRNLLVRFNPDKNGDDSPDCIYWYQYVSELVYKLPLGELLDSGSFATRFAILADGLSFGKVFVSPDDLNWQQVQVPIHKGNVYDFSIPVDLLLSKDLYVKVTDNLPRSYNVHVSGFALLK